MSTKNLSREKRKEVKDFILANHKKIRVRKIAQHLSISHPTVLFHMYSMGLKTPRKSRIVKMHMDSELFNVNEKHCWLIG